MSGGERSHFFPLGLEGAAPLVKPLPRGDDLEEEVPPRKGFFFLEDKTEAEEEEEGAGGRLEE